MAIESDAIAKSLLQFHPEVIAQRTHQIHRRKIARKFGCLAKADRKQGALGARATTTFVTRTMNERLKRYAATNEKRTHPLWRIEFMAGNRKEIDSELVYIGRNFADGLRCIGVKHDAMLMSNAGAIFNRLDGADLVVGMHDAY